MKIKVIIPVSTGKWNEEVEARYSAIKAPETVIEVMHLTHGPEAIQSEYDEASVTPYVLKEVSSALKRKYDGILIYCFSDPALSAAREVSTIPVTGIGESSQLFAMGIADRIGIIATVDHTVPKIRRKLSARGFSGRFPSVRGLNIPVLELDEPERVITRALQVTGIMVHEDGVEALILGCGSMLNIKERIQEAFSIPVIEPGEVALKHLEALIRLGISHSKKAFMTPLPVNAL